MVRPSLFFNTGGDVVFRLFQLGCRSPTLPCFLQRSYGLIKIPAICVVTGGIQMRTHETASMLFIIVIAQGPARLQVCSKLVDFNRFLGSALACQTAGEEVLDLVLARRLSPRTVAWAIPGG